MQSYTSLRKDMEGRKKKQLLYVFYLVAWTFQQLRLQLSSQLTRNFIYFFYFCPVSS